MMAKAHLTVTQREVVEALLKCKNFVPNKKLGIRPKKKKDVSK